MHCLFCLFFFYNFLSPVLIGEDKTIKGEAVDFDIMDGMLSSDLDPVYDKTSEFIIKPSSLINRDKKGQSLANLLERLKESKPTGLSFGRTSREGRKRRSQIGQAENKLKAGLGWKKTKKKVSPLKSQFWENVKMSKSEAATEGSMDHGGIMKVIDKHSFEFQDCYERALLKDESLSGKVIFLLKLNQSKVKKAGLELKGEGNPPSRRELTRCLFQESKKLVFLNNKGNISIKFNLIFGL